TLRTSGELLQGIVRVYSKQATFLLTDIKDTLTKISMLVIFTDVLKSITKREASRGFFDILSLATEGCIGLSQTEAFGNIKIDA
uniref:Sister chromatid cohesion protein 1,Sister chromatid cohesion protein 1,Sister chromatid cohesion protein 1 n=1 Tax=Saccharomyces cerevisiae (strain ATCC 204508 / S288c) TaxID=559292 RepID=UPI00168D9C2F|nr:Chain C, Sister chromatid cohesion protein 1,Sister chromatid cohesion protein 1,Sister chromatid cohesion protein 1 [Saccharomyces cerevisiae S288C]